MEPSSGYFKKLPAKESGRLQALLRINPLDSISQIKRLICSIVFPPVVFCYDFRCNGCSNPRRARGSTSVCGAHAKANVSRQKEQMSMLFQLAEFSRFKMRHQQSIKSILTVELSESTASQSYCLKTEALSMGLPWTIILTLLTTTAFVGSEEYTAFNQEKVRRLDCTSCGEECAASCGTKLFRTCCLSFARKRSGGFTVIDDIGNGSEEDWRGHSLISAEDSLTYNRLLQPRYFKTLQGQSHRPKKESGSPKVVWSLMP